MPSPGAGDTHPVLTDGDVLAQGSPAKLGKKAVWAPGRQANQTEMGEKATHCRVTVGTPGTGRSISRSRRLQRRTEAPSVTSADLPPTEGALPLSTARGSCHRPFCAGPDAGRPQRHRARHDVTSVTGGWRQPLSSLLAPPGEPGSAGSAG